MEQTLIGQPPLDVLQTLHQAAHYWHGYPDVQPVASPCHAGTCITQVDDMIIDRHQDCMNCRTKVKKLHVEF